MECHAETFLPDTPPVSTSAAPAAATLPALSSTPAADPAMLVNVLDDLSLSSSSAQQQDSLTPGAEEGFMKFLFKNNGVLFENDVLQIGIKSEYKKNLGIVLLVLIFYSKTHTFFMSRRG